MTIEIGPEPYVPEVRTETVTRGAAFDAALDHALGSIDARPAKTSTPTRTEAPQPAAAIPEHAAPAYAQVHEQSMAARQIALEDAQLDQLIRDFTARYDVDYFDERAVMEIWHRLGSKPADLEKAWKMWRDSTVTFDAAKRAIGGPKGTQQGALDAAIAATEELSQRQDRYRVTREVRTDAKATKSARLDAALDAALGSLERSKKR